jgi:ankyrin repeat protein
MLNFITKILRGNNVFAAVKAGDSRKLRSLLESGASISATDKHGFTPLYWAIQLNHASIVELFLAHGADVNEQFPGGSTPLLSALQVEGSGKATVVKCLVKRGASVQARSLEGATALHLAAQWGNRSVVECLLDHGADPRAVDRHGRTPLDFAECFDTKFPIKIAIESAIEALLTKDEKELLRLAADGRTKEIRALLEKGVSPTVRKGDGSTALHLALEGGHAYIAECLLSHGADVNARSDDGETPLHIAARLLDKQMVKHLLTAGADPNAKCSFCEVYTDYCPLHSAMSSGVQPITEAGQNEFVNSARKRIIHLVSSGENPSDHSVFADSDHEKLLQRQREAVRLSTKTFQQCQEVMEVLLDGGADPNAAYRSVGNSDEIVPLDEVLLYGQFGFTAEQASVLLRKGANPNREFGGHTYLHVALLKRNVRLVAALLAGGARTDIKDKDGRSFLDWADSPDYAGVFKKALVLADETLAKRASTSSIEGSN